MTKIKLTEEKKDKLWNILYSVKHEIIDIDNGIDQIENLNIQDSGGDCHCAENFPCERFNCKAKPPQVEEDIEEISNFNNLKEVEITFNVNVYNLATSKSFKEVTENLGKKINELVRAFNSLKNK